MHAQGKSTDEWRTGDTHFVQHRDEAIAAINQRVAALTHLPANHQEALQVP